MYNPPESGIDSLEYIEIYNPGDTLVDLTGFQLEGITYVFDSISIAPFGTIVVAKDSNAMKNTYLISSLQWVSGSLSNQGERIAILDTAGQVIDELMYDNTGDWPREADGEGSSLILCDVASDNTLAVNWALSQVSTGDTLEGFLLKGSPGILEACVVPPVDSIPPSLTTLTLLSNTEIQLTFDEPIDTSSIDTALFIFSPELGIDSIQRVDSNASILSVILSDTLRPCITYTLEVSGLADTAFNIIDTVQLSTFSFCPPDTLSPVLLEFELLSAKEFSLIFNEPLDKTALDIANFSLIPAFDSTASIPLLNEVVVSGTGDTLIISIVEGLTRCVDYKIAYEVADTTGNISLTQSELTAKYCPGAIELTITEIMYNPPEKGFDFLEYIEILNTGQNPATMSRVTLPGIDIDWGSLVLEPDSFLIIVSDSSSFAQIYGYTQAIEWESEKNLPNGSFRIALTDDDGTLLDEVTYNTDAPWPSEANGFGGSLILCDVEADNGVATNWSVSENMIGIKINAIDLKGSPGFLEECPVIIIEKDTIPPSIISAERVDNQLRIAFDEPIQLPSLGDQVTVEGASVSGIMLTQGSDTLLITLENLPGPCEFIDLSLEGVEDTASNLITNPIELAFSTFCEEIPPLVISEIFYDFPSEDTLRFMEIYHTGFEPVNIRGYKLGGDITYTFPDTILYPGQYLVIAEVSEAFESAFGGKVLEWDEGTLNGTVRLINPSDLLVDEVNYMEVSPWPENPVNSITSLELTRATLDNALPDSWQRSKTFAGYFFSDTLKASPGFPPQNIPAVRFEFQDSTLCSVDTLVLDANNPGSVYRWSTGDTSQTITITESGTYEVVVNNGVNLDTGRVSINLFPELAVDDLVQDSICADSVVVFNNPSDSATYWLWDFGNGIQSTNSDPGIIYDEPGIYVVSLALGNDIAVCPEVRDTVVIESCNIPTQVKRFLEGAVEVFPNPVEDELTIRGSWQRATEGVIRITDATGRVFYTQTWERENEWDFKWNTTSLSSGIYYVILRVGEAHQTFKIIK